jgi:hypothetical protein
MKYLMNLPLTQLPILSLIQPYQTFHPHIKNLLISFWMSILFSLVMEVFNAFWFIRDGGVPTLFQLSFLYHLVVIPSIHKWWSLGIFPFPFILPSFCVVLQVVLHHFVMVEGERSCASYYICVELGLLIIMKFKGIYYPGLSFLLSFFIHLNRQSGV